MDLTSAHQKQSHYNFLRKEIKILLQKNQCQKPKSVCALGQLIKQHSQEEETKRNTRKETYLQMQREGLPTGSMRKKRERLLLAQNKNTWGSSTIIHYSENLSNKVWVFMTAFIFLVPRHTNFESVVYHHIHRVCTSSDLLYKSSGRMSKYFKNRTF